MSTGYSAPILQPASPVMTGSWTLYSVNQDQSDPDSAAFGQLYVDDTGLALLYLHSGIGPGNLPVMTVTGGANGWEQRLGTDDGNTGITLSTTTDPAPVALIDLGVDTVNDGSVYIEASDLATTVSLAQGLATIALEPGLLRTKELAADPAAPAANFAVLYAKDNGAGKTQLVARFATGAVQVIATQP
jgi:hypothetical protein